MMISKSAGDPFSALILAAGLSERMGHPKALLLWDDSLTFLEKLIGEFLYAGCREVVCVVNRDVLPFCLAAADSPNVRLILNPHPERERMHSVRLGLREIRDTAYCFLQNADNPFIHAGIIRKMTEHADPEAWCSPEYQGQGGHPVLLPAGFIQQVLREPSTGKTLQDILRRFPKKTVNMGDDSVLKNINTQSDYQSFLNEKQRP